MQSCTYYFESNQLKHAFEECLSVLQKELTTQQQTKWNRLILSVEMVGDNELGENSELITTSNIQAILQNLIAEFNIQVVQLFLSKKQIQDRLDEIISRGETQPKSYFSITLEKDSSYTTLFNVFFARSIEIEKYEDNECVKYEDFDYNPITDLIESVLENNSSLVIEYWFDHVGGDVDSKSEVVDLYYSFLLNQ